MKTPAIAVFVLFFWAGSLSQVESLEKQALTLVQRTPASDLDQQLPSVPLVSWFNQVVGPRAGVIWQLSECGEAIKEPADTAQKNTETPDLPACLEGNATLPDGRKVVIAILIGSFRKGLTGKADFVFGVVEYDEQLQSAKRLSDLPRLLVPTRRGIEAGHLAGAPREKPVSLPVVNADGMRIQWPLQGSSILLLSIDNDDLTANLGSEQPVSPPLTKTLPEEPSPPPPPNNQPQTIQRLVDKVLEGNAITKVEPVYPPTARVMKAFGTVRVQITISETGRVIDAKAISGHQALRSAAVEAASKWVFKPTTVNGSPIKVQGILNFTFMNNQ